MSENITKEDVVTFTKEEIDDLKKTLKQQIIEELKADEINKTEQLKKQREEEDKKYSEYVGKMQDSDTPWVDIKGWYDDPEHGVKVELDWNVAFIDYLKEHNFSGSTEDEIVQKWIIMLLRDMSEQHKGDKGDYE